MNKLISGAVVLLLVAACGGGGDSDPPVASDPTVAVPSTASQSSAGMTNYLDALTAVAETEANEPVSLDGFDPTQTQRDDTEPNDMS